jgi:hypothetical protein
LTRATGDFAAPARLRAPPLAVDFRPVDFWPVLFFAVAERPLPLFRAPDDALERFVVLFAEPRFAVLFVPARLVALFAEPRLAVLFAAPRFVVLLAEPRLAALFVPALFVPARFAVDFRPVPFRAPPFAAEVPPEPLLLVRPLVLPPRSAAPLRVLLALAPRFDAPPADDFRPPFAARERLELDEPVLLDEPEVLRDDFEPVAIMGSWWRFADSSARIAHTSTWSRHATARAARRCAVRAVAAHHGMARVGAIERDPRVMPRVIRAPGARASRRRGASAPGKVPRRRAECGRARRLPRAPRCPVHLHEDSMKRISIVLGAALLAACSSGDTDAADTATGAGAAPAAAADPDAATAGGGIPAGYLGQIDPPREGRAPADLTQANYTARDGRWEVRTGPAHIVYAAGDSASGSYTVAATVEQLEAPTHPEAFGLVIGGSNLDQTASQAYTYFIVRHTGEYMIRVREGATTRDVQGWTASPNVPKSDGSGRATYNLAARVGPDSVRFLVGDQPVAAVASSAVPTNGVAGLRINHNLHLMVTPPRITRN